MTTAALSARGLCKRFGSLVVADDIALELPAGARYALIGPNGAGKTTLINLLTGALQPDAGEIRLQGDPITKLSREDRVHKGLARTFQINTLFPALSALESVAMVICERVGTARRWWQSLSAQGAAIDKAYAILDSVGLAADACRPVMQLAYGQQRLVEVALALATEPRVLLLDEPAAGVPHDESGDLFKVISNLSGDLAVLFIEHDMELVFQFATHIIVMASGRVLTEGSPDDIMQDTQVREVYLGGLSDD